MTAATKSRKNPQLRVIRPSFAGTGGRVVVGGTTYSIRPHWPVRMSATGALAYVLVEGELHVLGKTGEIVGIADDVLAALRKTKFGL